MALNPTGEQTVLEVALSHVATSTGRFEVDGGRLELGPWSALVWRS